MSATSPIRGRPVSVSINDVAGEGEESVLTKDDDAGPKFKPKKPKAVHVKAASGWTGSWGSSLRHSSILDFTSSSRICPTCRGKGRIPRGEENELVALIPYKDKRLKPRRTYLYVIAVVVLFVLLGGVVLAFMFPRNINVKVSSVNNTRNWFTFSPNVSQLTMELESCVTVKNENFFPIQVHFVNLSFYHYEVLASDGYVGHVTVQTKSSSNVHIVQNATFKDSAAHEVFTVCTSFEHNNIIFKILTAVNYAYLSHSSDTIESGYHYVDCHF